MDPIKNFISATDPVHNDPSVPDGEAALRRMLSEPAAFSDSLPSNVTSLDDRKRRRARLAGVLTLAAAAVTAGVLVATNVGAMTTAPEPASTVAGLGTASATATPTASATPTPSGTPTSATTPTQAATVPAAAGGNGECTKENLTRTGKDISRVLPVITVVGCAEGWMGILAPAANDAPEPSPGDSFWIASLANGSYVLDSQDASSYVPSWSEANRNNDRLTAEEYMDKQFLEKGLPVRLRQALVGAPEPGSLAARGIKTYEQWFTGYKVSFDYPASWQLGDASGSNALANGPGTALTDSTGREVARLALGDTNEWTGCRNEAPYKVIDSTPMPGLPIDPAAPEQGAPRLVYVAMTSAVDDGGPVQAGIGITNRIAGQDGIACVLDLAVAGPGPLEFYSFSNRRPLGGPTWGLYKFQTMEEAAAFIKTQSYQDLKTVMMSLTVAKVN